MTEIQPGSDEWFAAVLVRRLQERLPHVQAMRNWYVGDAPFPYPDDPDANKKEVAESWRALQEAARMNVASVLVDARVPRMRVNGVQLIDDGSDSADEKIASFIQRSNFRSKASDAFRDALICGAGYLVLTEDGLMNSSPETTICQRDAHGKVIAALSVWVDIEKNEKVVNLARPGYSRRMRKKLSTTTTSPNNIPELNIASLSLSAKGWEWDEKIDTGLDDVPVYEFALDSGIISKYLPTLKRINHTLLQCGILVATQAFKQRGIIGAPTYDEDGNEIQYAPDMFKLSPGALWMLGEGTQMWESGAVDITPVRLLVKDSIEELAIESKTPLFLNTPDGASGSAEGSATQREGLAFDIEHIEDMFTASLQQLFADAMQIEGEEDRAEASRLMIDWVNPRRASAAERATAVQIATSAGVPLTVALRKFGGFSADEVAEVSEAEGFGALRDLVVQNATSGLANQRENYSPNHEHEQSHSFRDEGLRKFSPNNPEAGAEPGVDGASPYATGKLRSRAGGGE